MTGALTLDTAGNSAGQALYLTAELPGTGGVFKELQDDFVVEELPLYPPCGEGEHCYATLEKRGITTLEAIRRVARALSVAERDLGYAGMKDARGICFQTVSVPRIDPQALLALELPGVRVVAARRHVNKLRLGHLAGNRFTILLRDVVKDAAERAEAVLTILQKRGLPNWFGEQRYGLQGNSGRIGRAMLRQDYQEAIATLIGDPARIDDERWQAAIRAFQDNDLAESLRLFPGHCRTERDVLQRLQRKPENHAAAFRGVNPRLQKLFLSACQSELFDQVVASRLQSIDLLLHGDLACKHANGACFLVVDPLREEERVKAFEISPTGPMFGCRMTPAEGDQGRLEDEILQREGLRLADFALPGGLRMEGERRPLRVPVGEPSVTKVQDGLRLVFSLPRGAYATALLREVMKVPVHGQGAAS